jgi:hypothetical protein
MPEMVWTDCSVDQTQTLNAVCAIVVSGKPEEFAAGIYHDVAISRKVASLGFVGLIFSKHEANAEPHTNQILFGMKATANGWEPLPSTALPPFLETADYYYQEGVKLQSSGDPPSAKTWFEAVVAKFPKSNLVASAQERLAAVNEAIAKAEADRAAEMQSQQRKATKCQELRSEIETQSGYAQGFRNDAAKEEHYLNRSNADFDGMLSQAATAIVEQDQEAIRQLGCQ